jgi:hypothetical protein
MLSIYRYKNLIPQIFFLKTEFDFTNDLFFLKTEVLQFLSAEQSRKYSKIARDYRTVTLLNSYER